MYSCFSDEGDTSDARLDSDESISSEKLRGYHAVVVRNLPKRHKGYSLLSEIDDVGVRCQLTDI